MIYFITDMTNIKIGYTKNDVYKRLKQLQTGCANNLYLLGWIDGDKTKEKELHKKFSNYKIRFNGEWFCPSVEVLDYINKNNLQKNTYVDIIDGKVMSFLSVSVI